jgi:hypothetical protein
VNHVYQLAYVSIGFEILIIFKMQQKNMCSFKMNDYHTTHKFLKQIPYIFTPICKKNHSKSPFNVNLTWGKTSFFTSLYLFRPLALSNQSKVSFSISSCCFKIGTQPQEDLAHSSYKTNEEVESL